MLITIATITNILALIAIILLFTILYKKVKIESGKWTARMFIFLLILGIGLRNNKNSKNNSKIQYNHLSEKCNDCLLKPNKKIKIEDNFSIFQNVNHWFELYVNKNNEDVKLINRNTTLSGITMGSTIEIHSATFENKKNGKINYKIHGTWSSPFFLFINYTGDYFSEGEVEAIPIDTNRNEIGFN